MKLKEDSENAGGYRFRGREESELYEKEGMREMAGARQNREEMKRERGIQRE